MLKRNILLCSLAVLVAAVSSCIFDPAPTPPVVKPPVQSFKPLTEKENVLNNMEVAYNKRRPDKYNELLDDAFTFFYTAGDVGGGEVPVQWNRPVEVTTTEGLLADADKIDMDIRTENGLTWVEVTPENTPDERWYTTTLYYEFTIDIGETTYIPESGAKAQFTVRNAGTTDAPDWRLVEFRDLGGV